MLSKIIFRQEVFEIYLDVMEQFLRNQQSLRWRRRMRYSGTAGEESLDVINR